MNVPSHWPGPDNIVDFSYSKLEHFTLFRGLPFQSYNIGDPDPAICDLKVYQDYLVYCFIRRNVPPGSRILEVGGGDSRILKHFSNEYECWNVDKCEGLGNGPVKFTSPHYRIIYDYIGAFNTELKDRSFDFVFSISALEHTPEDQPTRTHILKDITRILRPGCPSLHCFDAILRREQPSWTNGLIPYLQVNAPVRTILTPIETIHLDKEAYFMSETAYETNWMPITKEAYETFGRPFSYNVAWWNE